MNKNIISERDFIIMIKSTYPILNDARQRLVAGEGDLASTYYSRAYALNLPSSLVELHQMTKGYMFLGMAENSPITYFECLKKSKTAADSNEQYREEYKAALETLVNIKDLFLRDVAVNYFCEVSTCSWGSNYGRSLDDIYLYLNKYLDEITEKDCYGFGTYKAGFDLKKLRRDLKTVQAYALNLLLMYVTHKSTHYEGKTYTANTMVFDNYAYTQVNSHDNYSHNACARPRLYQLLKNEYYPDYLAAFNSLKKELNISTEEELKKEVSRLVDCADAKNQLEKEFFDYSKKLAKVDLERQSFFNTFGGINPFYFMVKPILKAGLGAEEVGKFTLDEPFTRKRFLGVCNMLAWANDWSVEMVRAIMIILSCCGIGIFAYFGLYLAAKANFYLPNFSVDKHI